MDIPVGPTNFDSDGEEIIYYDLMDDEPRLRHVFSLKVFHS